MRASRRSRAKFHCPHFPFGSVMLGWACQSVRNLVANGVDNFGVRSISDVMARKPNQTLSVPARAEPTLATAQLHTPSLFDEFVFGEKVQSQRYCLS